MKVLTQSANNGESDYILSDRAKNVWIQVDNVAIHIYRGDEAVSVDMYANGHAADGPNLGSTYAEFAEAQGVIDKALFGVKS